MEKPLSKSDRDQISSFTQSSDFRLLPNDAVSSFNHELNDRSKLIVVRNLLDRLDDILSEDWRGKESLDSSKRMLYQTQAASMIAEVLAHQVANKSWTKSVSPQASEYKSRYARE